jgi:hypothetical protein
MLSYARRAAVLPMLAALFAVLQLAALHWGCSAADPSDTMRPYAFRPGVWLDPDRGRAYLTATAGGTEAVSLATGQILWRTDALLRPLWASRERLLGRGRESPGALHFVMLDIVDAPRVIWQSSVALPTEVQSQDAAGPFNSFELRVWLRGGDLQAVWQYQQLPTSLPLDREGTQREAVRVVTGGVRLDFESGEATASDPAGMPPETPVAPTGKVPAPGTTTASGAMVRYASADGRHYLASRPPSSPSEKAPTYRWEIYAADTGRRVAEIEQPLLAARFFVHGSLLVHDAPSSATLAPGGLEVGPPALRAVRLEDGSEVWTHSYRDPGYKGPLPPRQL